MHVADLANNALPFSSPRQRGRRMIALPPSFLSWLTSYSKVEMQSHFTNLCAKNVFHCLE